MKFALHLLSILLLNGPLLGTTMRGEKSSSEIDQWVPDCDCDRGNKSPLCILFFSPSNRLIRSHVNFAASLVRVLRQQFSVCFIVPVTRSADQLDEATTRELDVQYYKFGKEPSPEEEAQLEAMDLDSKLTQVQGPFYTKLWSDMLKKSGFMDALHQRGFNVGIAEMSHPSRFAFAIFHALNLPHVINIKTDPRTKAFVSHCGRNSQLEAAYNGVPLICVPMAFDQFYNAESMARHKVAIVLDYHSKVEDKRDHFTVPAVKKAIHETVYRFKPNIDGKKLKKLSETLKMKEQPAKVLLNAMQEIEEEEKEKEKLGNKRIGQEAQTH